MRGTQLLMCGIIPVYLHSTRIFTVYDTFILNTCFVQLTVSLPMCTCFSCILLDATLLPHVVLDSPVRHGHELYNMTTVNT